MVEYENAPGNRGVLIAISIAGSRHCEDRRRRSDPAFAGASGLLRGACHRAALRADPLARNDAELNPAPAPSACPASAGLAARRGLARPRGAQRVGGAAPG